MDTSVTGWFPFSAIENRSMMSLKCGQHSATQPNNCHTEKVRNVTVKECHILVYKLPLQFSKKEALHIVQT